MYNKNMFKKTNDKKVLHKIGKHWAVVSVALLALISGGYAATQTSSNVAPQTAVAHANAISTRANVNFVDDQGETVGSAAVNEEGTYAATNKNMASGWQLARGSASEINVDQPSGNYTVNVIPASSFNSNAADPTSESAADYSTANTVDLVDDSVVVGSASESYTGNYSLNAGTNWSLLSGGSDVQLSSGSNKINVVPDKSYSVSGIHNVGQVAGSETIDFVYNSSVVGSSSFALGDWSLSATHSGWNQPSNISATSAITSSVSVTPTSNVANVFNGAPSAANYTSTSDVTIALYDGGSEIASSVATNVGSSTTKIDMTLNNGWSAVPGQNNVNGKATVTSYGGSFALSQNAGDFGTAGISTYNINVEPTGGTNYFGDTNGSIPTVSGVVELVDSDDPSSVITSSSVNSEDYVDVNTSNGWDVASSQESGVKPSGSSDADLLIHSGVNKIVVVPTAGMDNAGASSMATWLDQEESPITADFVYDGDIVGSTTSGEITNTGSYTFTLPSGWVFDNGSATSTVTELYPGHSNISVKSVVSGFSVSLISASSATSSGASALFGGSNFFSSGAPAYIPNPGKRSQVASSKANRSASANQSNRSSASSAPTVVNTPRSLNGNNGFNVDGNPINSSVASSSSARPNRANLRRNRMNRFNRRPRRTNRPLRNVHYVFFATPTKRIRVHSHAKFTRRNVVAKIGRGAKLQVLGFTKNRKQIIVSLGHGHKGYVDVKSVRLSRRAVPVRKSRTRRVNRNRRSTKRVRRSRRSRRNVIRRNARRVRRGLRRHRARRGHTVRLNYRINIYDRSGWVARSARRGSKLNYRHIRRVGKHLVRLDFGRGDFAIVSRRAFRR